MSFCGCCKALGWKKISTCEYVDIKTRLNRKGVQNPEKKKFFFDSEKKMFLFFLNFRGFFFWKKICVSERKKKKFFFFCSILNTDSLAFSLIFCTFFLLLTAFLAVLGKTVLFKRKLMLIFNFLNFLIIEINWFYSKLAKTCFFCNFFI